MTHATTLIDAARPITTGRIPVRNLWLLLLYASDLARFGDRFDAAVEESPDLPDLVARLLCFAVEHRLRRNLSRGYMLIPGEAAHQNEMMSPVVTE
jgi:5-methylcytosine-specific restriction enzyme subunit McrC